MLKVGSKISLSNQSAMDKLGQLRKRGKWLVTNRNRTIIKFIGNEQDAIEFFEKQRHKRGGAFVLEALRTATITADQIAESMVIHRMINNSW